MTSSSPRTEILHCVQNDRVKGPSHNQCCLDFFPPDTRHPGSVSRQSEGPFMGRLRANFGQLAHPMQDVHSNLREYRKAPPRSRSRPRRRAPEPSSPTGRSPQRWEKISSAPVSSSTSRSHCLFSASFLILSASFGTITLSV